MHPRTRPFRRLLCFTLLACGLLTVAACKSKATPQDCQKACANYDALLGDTPDKADMVKACEDKCVDLEYSLEAAKCRQHAKDMESYGNCPL